MASLTKDGARKFIATNGRLLPVFGVQSATGLPTFGFWIAADDGKDFKLQLSPDEMMFITRCWLEHASRNCSLGKKTP